jgi:transcriptional regulator with XRE-family HTH domain
MPPDGPILPRTDTALKNARQAMQGVAFQIGVLLAVERHRWRLLQRDLARKVGMKQASLSRIENGKPAPGSVTDAQIDKLFRALSIPRPRMYAGYVKWWRDHGVD